MSAEAPAAIAAWAHAGDSVATLRRSLARAFRQAGLDTPDLDARILVGHALGLDHAALAAASDRALTAMEFSRIDVAAARRLAREPVAHIVGHKEFWGLTLAVTGATLVPRPETETVVEAALATLDRGGGRERPLRIADLGTGSGALLLALLSELPRAFGIGTDMSIEAVVIARNNAKRLGFEQRSAFLIADFAAALAGGFDLVVSNPPYVETRDIATLPPEVRDHEPRLALDGGDDGLEAYGAIARHALRLLSPSGHLVVEFGRGQEGAVAAVFARAGLAPVGAAVADLAGIPRVLILTRY